MSGGVQGCAPRLPLLSSCLDTTPSGSTLFRPVVTPLNPHAIKTMSLTTRTALSVAIVSLISACGGGESSSSAPASSLSGASAQANAIERLRALAAGGGATSAAATTITNAQFFQWAGVLLPSVFPANPGSMTLNAEGMVWDIRAYSNGMYLAVASNGRAYGLGPITGNQLVDLGVMQGFSAQVCSTINCNPPTGGGGGGTGSLNECTMPASQALQAGNRWNAVYTSSSFLPTTLTGEYTLAATVDGAATFEGQSTVKTSATLTGRQLGIDLNNTSATYSRAAQNDLTEIVGIETDMTVVGMVTRVKVVNTPPDPNTEFTLSAGGTLTKTVTATTSTSFVGLPLPPQTNTGSTTQTFKFEARESISVQGRSYDTCRYRQTDSSGNYSLQWHIVGKGFGAKFEQYTPAGALAGRSELKSATFNGAPV